MVQQTWWQWNKKENLSSCGRHVRLRKFVFITTARLNDAVAIVTHHFLESRAKSALISITSFSGRCCVRCFTVCSNSTAFQSPVLEVAARSLSFRRRWFSQNRYVVSSSSSSALLCRLDVPRPLEHTIRLGGH